MIPINIVIGDRTYRIKIDPQSEEYVRMMMKSINDKILEFKTQFAGKDMQDFVAMALIWIATSTPDERYKTDEKLEEIARMLDERLKK